jgi:hypothetical protein
MNSLVGILIVSLVLVAVPECIYSSEPDSVDFYSNAVAFFKSSFTRHLQVTSEQSIAGYDKETAIENAKLGEPYPTYRLTYTVALNADLLLGPERTMELIYINYPVEICDHIYGVIRSSVLGSAHFSTCGGTDSLLLRLRAEYKGRGDYKYYQIHIFKRGHQMVLVKDKNTYYAGTAYPETSEALAIDLVVENSLPETTLDSIVPQLKALAQKRLKEMETKD